MAETPNPINDAPPSSTLEVENLSEEEALLKKLPPSGENADKKQCWSVSFEETTKHEFIFIFREIEFL